MSLDLREGDLEGFFQVPFEVYPAGSPYVTPMRADLTAHDVLADLEARLA